MLRDATPSPSRSARLERAAQLAAEADAVLELTATPARHQLRVARRQYIEALDALGSLDDEASPVSSHSSSSRELSRRVSRLLARARRAEIRRRLRAHLRQIVYGAGLACGLASAALLATWLWRHAHPDVLRGRAFRTSSEWARCEPEKRRCAGTPTAIFFHTNEEPEPFIVYDLGQVRSLRRVDVTNRRDNDLAMRAVPLALQASLDGLTWHQLARRDYWFDVWRAEFPSARARYLKLAVARRSILHLERVQAWE